MSAAAVHVIEGADSAAAVLQHPLRLRILGELAEPDSASGLSRRLGMPRQKLNYHLRQLESEGLVGLVEERRKRNCTERIVQAVARSYVISPSTLGALASDPDRIRDRASSAFLVATANRVIQEVAELRRGADAAEKRLPTLTLQADIRFASPQAQSAFAQELTEALSTLVARYHDEQADGGRAYRLVAAAYPTPVRTTT
jgi:DNA-binding transcriptional ArsR family regulator